MTIRNREEMLGEVDMLKGNINRICVSDNVEEISQMYHYALMRLEELMKYNVRRVVERKKNIED